ncbi:MAG: MogA/MoaB family molybdenum cofactor biosynthesis protein [Chloroflexota bacterium]|nr:MogA/MoaB family molybdenum cofactor biosynthesis protein [Chloroflexota bacterium]MDE2892922.1 MogA/MoaB family molybdenum cofactor biosynthesis protein [Chloroflexota bacterium]
MSSNFTAAVLTLSDQGATGKREDTSGPAVREHLANLGIDVTDHAIQPDDPDLTVDRLRQWVETGVSLIVTTGGTGFGPRDNTPEATRRVIERDAPGLAELMRAEGLRKTPMAALSRGLCGIAERTLIVNLPGSERAVRENLDALAPVLPHALQLIGGDTEH